MSGGLVHALWGKLLTKRVSSAASAAYTKSLVVYFKRLRMDTKVILL